MYFAVSVNSEGLLAVTDEGNRCVHLLTDNGTLVRSIGKGVIDGLLVSGVAFDLKGNVWVTDSESNKVVKLSQDGQLLQTIHHASSEGDCLHSPCGVSISREGLIFICDNIRVTVHDEDAKFLFAFGSFGSGPGCFNRCDGAAFGSDGLVYVTDKRNKRVSVWSKDGTFRRDFKTKYVPDIIAATNDNHLLITSFSFHMIMIYKLEGKLVHEFGGYGSQTGKFIGPCGICIDDNGRVYVVDSQNYRVQIF